MSYEIGSGLAVSANILSVAPGGIDQDHVGFNYAGSTSKGGMAANADLLRGMTPEQITATAIPARAGGKVVFEVDGSTLSIESR
jgi:hypothetical protein